MPMLNAKLLYNPKAGRNRESRSRTVRQVISVLHARGFQVQAEATRARGTGAQQAADAVRQGAAAVFACGGDGTVHDVLQGLAGTGSLLGIIPFGSANALAQELGIPRDPVQAASAFHPGRSLQFRTTAVERADHSTLYSLCMAGAGPDGLLMYRMLTVDRATWGRWRYYEHALRLFWTHHFTPFCVVIKEADDQETEHSVVSAMTLRVGDLRGVFRGLARGASIHSDSLHVILVTPPARVTLPLWFLLSWLRLSRFHPGVTMRTAKRIRTVTAVPLQVDGEWVGRVVTSITMNGPLQRVLVPETTA